ncbi:hypothetical protein HZB74_03530 [Candidatus Saccharibacteria bacterium]|nr:hypothetical protein [Candidatus Saccharibacteria bacterium]
MDSSNQNNQGANPGGPVSSGDGVNANPIAGEVLVSSNSTQISATPLNQQRAPSPQPAQTYQTQAPSPPQAPRPTPPAPPVQQSAHTPPTPTPRINPNSTQNNLQIAEIRDGIVIMNDGSYRSVVMLKSINFDLMSPAEREGVEFSYQNFLNSLYFPVQIFVRSEKVDIAPYIEKLDKIRAEHDNMLLALLMDDYINYIDQLAAETNIMDKHFYVVIPFLPKERAQKPITESKNLLSGMFSMFSPTNVHVVIDENKLEEAKTELRNRVQAVLSGLLECGVQGLPLDTQELIELYYDTYNPDTATRQHLRKFDDLSVPVVTKGQGQAPQPNLDKELDV